MQEVPIAPVLDMMVSIIFFLLLSTTYYSFTFQPVPPSQSVTITDPLEPPPRSPRLLIFTNGNVLNANLNWAGVEPGVMRVQSRLPSDPSKYDPVAKGRIQKLVEQFAKKYPEEKAIQVGFGSDVNYQIMISILEAVTPFIHDVALLSYRETEALTGQ